MSWQHLHQPQGWKGVIPLSLSLSQIRGLHIARTTTIADRWGLFHPAGLGRLGVMKACGRKMLPAIFLRRPFSQALFPSFLPRVLKPVIDPAPTLLWGFIAPVHGLSPRSSEPSPSPGPRVLRPPRVLEAGQ